MMWALRLKTGLRPEETYGLHIGDVDVKSKIVRIERAVSLGKIKSTKTHEKRRVDLSDSVVAALSDYLTFVKAEAVANNWPEPY